MIRRV